MWLFDLFAKHVNCPWCGNTGARQALWGTVKCPNRNCDYFDAMLFNQRQMALDKEEQAKRQRQMQAGVAAGTVRQQRNPRTGEPAYKKLPAGDFNPREYRIVLSYQNFLGEQKTFTGDWRTLRRRGKHVSLRVEPTGIRIALATDRIQNIGDVQTALERCPTPQESRVLRYHAKRGTTSERCEELRRKYPDWRPNP